MRADEKAKVIGSEAGVEIASGSVILVAAMSTIYSAIRTLGEIIINLIG